MSNIFYHTNSTELERTPGAVAVSGYKAGFGRDENSLPESSKQTHKVFDTDNSSSNLEHTCADSSWVMLGQCQKHPDEHNFLMTVRCGKEHCPICGQKGSEYHKRRISRVLPKAMQIDKMGYIVIEFPDAYRKDVELAYSKKGLQRTTNKIVDALAGKRMGRRGRVGGFFPRGIIRWHWFGDKHADGDYNKWNPHCNILVDSSYIDKERLEDMKTAIRSAVDIPDLIIHYKFADTPAKKYHRVAYITRATFRNVNWNRYMAVQLSERKYKRDKDGNLIIKKNKQHLPIVVRMENGDLLKDERGNQVYEYETEAPFRNQRYWGHWEDLNEHPEAAVWHMDDKEQESELLIANKLGDNCCPVPGCTGKIVWSKPIDSRAITEWNAEKISKAGYYRIPEKAYTGPRIDYTDRRSLLEVMKWTKNYNLLMRVRDNEAAWIDSLAYIDTLDELDNIPDDFDGHEIQGEIWMN